MASPSEGAQVVGKTVRIVLVGEGGDAAATFRMDLDGRSIDATGTIGGVFTTLSVRPNEQVVFDVDVAPGDHTLTVTPNFDPDAQQETTVRRFSVVEETAGGGAIGLVLAGLAIGVAILAAVVVRRKAASAGDAAPPGDRPASGRAAP